MFFYRIGEGGGTESDSKDCFPQSKSEQLNLISFKDNNNKKTQFLTSFSPLFPLKMEHELPDLGASKVLWLRVYVFVDQSNKRILWKLLDLAPPKKAVTVSFNWKKW